jgi:hypothetical protein
LLFLSRNGGSETDRGTSLASGSCIKLNVVGEFSLLFGDTASITTLSSLDLLTEDLSSEFENLVLDFTVLDFILVYTPS